MNYTKLPSVKSLIAFEAVVRYGGVCKAAEELNVTHSAVSQNLGQLEEYFGEPLFNKKGRKLFATNSALIYADEISSALNILASATKSFCLRSEPNSLVLKIVSSLALRWLIPKISLLKEQLPELKLRLITESESNIDLNEGEIDVAVGFAHQSQLHSYYSAMLYPSELVLLSSKCYSSVDKAIKGNHAIFVSAPLRKNDWSSWCQHMQIEQPAMNNRTYLSNSAQALEAVSSGGGILVTQRILAEQLIGLENVFQVGQSLIQDESGYFFYCDHDSLKRPSVALLRDWMLTL